MPPARDPRHSSPSCIAGELGRALGLPVPEIVLVELDAALGRGRAGSRDPGPARPERRPGHRYRLPARRAAVRSGGGPACPEPSAPEPELAADIVWFDALITNVDRTAQNVNLLVWHRRLWLIDHGAALYIHHTWRDPAAHARRPFERIADHVLLPYAGSIVDADGRLAARVDSELLARDRRARSPRPGSATGPTTSDGRTSTTCWPTRAPGRVRRGGGACPCRGVARSSTPSSGSSRGSIAASCSTPGIVLHSRPRRFLDARVELDPGGPPRARPRLRPGRGPRPPRDDPADRGRRSGRRADRPAEPSRALPLAGRPEQHDRPAVGGPHRPDRRPGGHARAPLRDARPRSPLRSSEPGAAWAAA